MFHTPPHKVDPSLPQAGTIENDPFADHPGVVVNQPEPDVQVTNHGSIFIISPQTRAAMEWAREHLAKAQRFGFGYAVEHRYVGDVVQGMIDDGLKVA